MNNDVNAVDRFLEKEYEHGFITNIESDTLPPGLNEEVIRFISAKKGEPDFMLQWRLTAFRHWQQMNEPQWAHLQW